MCPLTFAAPSKFYITGQRAKMALRIWAVDSCSRPANKDRFFSNVKERKCVLTVVSEGQKPQVKRLKVCQCEA